MNVVERPDHRPPSNCEVFSALLAHIGAPPYRVSAWLLGYSLVQVVLLGTMGLLLGLGIRSEGDEVQIHLLQFTEPGIPPGPGALGAAALLVTIAGLFFTQRVWRGARGPHRDFHWSLPVERRRHDLLRVAAGAVWLAAIAAALLAAALVSTALAGNASATAGLPLSAWLAFFAAPVLVYLLASAFELGKTGLSSRAVAAVAALALVFYGFVSLEAGGSFGKTLEALCVGPFGLVTATIGPLFWALAPAKLGPAEPWFPAFTVWLCLALVILLAAAGRTRRD